MRFIFFWTFCSLLTTTILNSQATAYDSKIDPLLYSKFEASVVYLNSFKVDSAGLILDSIIAAIEGTDTYDSPFGLRVQVRKAEVLERDNEGDLALLAFQELKIKALKSKVWDVYAYASINLGLLYEKIGKDKDCIHNLRDAQKVLKKYPDLDYIYPFFCVRISSYHRIYENRDSAIYYAKECLRTFEKYNEYAQGGDGFMLLTMLSDEKDIDTRIAWAKSAAKIFKKLENHNAFCAMESSLSGFHYSKQDYPRAILYNDTAIASAKRSIEGGFDVHRLLYNSYKFRGQIYAKLGQYDSSSYYITKGYELHNKHILEENQSKVLEMDAKYKDDKKALKIKEQEEQLKSAKVQKTLMMIIFGLVILFTSGLLFYYYKLRKANRQTKLQAEQIKKTNKELSISLNRQITLQGEVHHRVKIICK